MGSSTSRRVIRSIHVLSDGTEETGLVVYNNSDFIADVSKGNLQQIWIMGSFTGIIRLAWDEATDHNIISVGQSNSGHIDFREFGGFQNPNADTPVGDILLTTLALGANDEFTIVIDVKQD